MATQNNEIPADLADAIEFHGHLCPGLVIGYIATKAAMQRLAADRSADEELIAIVENDSCAVDAVQFFASCTVGKGNLFRLDHGKMVFTFAVRPSGRAVRMSLKHRTTPAQVEQAPEGSPERRELQIQYMLQQPAEELFDISTETIDLPDTASIYETKLCEQCGEMVMAPRTRNVGGKLLCIPCAQAAGRKG